MYNNLPGGERMLLLYCQDHVCICKQFKTKQLVIHQRAAIIVVQAYYDICGLNEITT